MNLRTHLFCSQQPGIPFTPPTGGTLCSCPPSQVKDGHLSIYQVLSKLGFSHPGKVWKGLLAQHGGDFVPHTRMQFDMADGRKGRMAPAIRVEDLHQLLEQVRQMTPEGQTRWFFLPAEQQVIDFLMDAFADQQPESPCMVQDVMVDLFFHRCKLAVVFVSAAEPEILRIQKLQQAGIQVVHANVYHQDFRPGTLFREVRILIDLKPDASPDGTAPGSRIQNPAGHGS